MGDSNKEFYEFIFSQHEEFLSSLTNEEMLKYTKDMAIIKLKPFFKKWIHKHFGITYLIEKKEKEKKRLENLDFYYAMLSGDI